MIPHSEAVILTGGQSRRMGRDKASLALNGQALVSRLVDTLSPLFERIRLVGEPRGSEIDRRSWPASIGVEPDSRPGEGPLAGLETALASTQNDWVFLAASDYPFLSANFVAGLGDYRESSLDAVVPVTEHGSLPTLSFYHRRALSVVSAQLDEGRRAARALLSHIAVRRVLGAELQKLDPTGQSLVTVNTPEEWDKARGEIS